MNMRLIENVKEIIKVKSQEIKNTGLGFNLISILGMENLETRTHSKIIAELLDSKGSHNFGNKFLELFLKHVGINDFDKSNYNVVREEYFSDVNCSGGETMRTFLDIVIKEVSTGRVILIENKIWADDQFEQLERYYECYQDKIIKLLYLNVFEYDYTFNLESLERNLTEQEENKLSKIKNVYQSISYETIIKNWLVDCIKQSSKKPYVNQQIEAYLQTVLKISNQSIYNKMATTIFDKIMESSENFETAEKISQQYNEANNYLKNEFFKRLYAKINSHHFESKQYGIIHITITEDGDPLYLGIQLYNNDKFVSDNEGFNAVIKLLKEKFVQNNPQTNNWWNAWFYASENSLLFKNHIHSLDSNKKIELYHNLEEQVDIIYNEFSAIINSLNDLLNE